MGLAFATYSAFEKSCLNCLYSAAFVEMATQQNVRNLLTRYCGLSVAMTMLLKEKHASQNQAKEGDI